MNIWQVINVEVLQYDWVLGTLILKKIKKEKKMEENSQFQLQRAQYAHFPQWLQTWSAKVDR